MNNENGIVRIKERDFAAFYHALNQVSEMTGLPVQTLYEIWLTQVIEGMTFEQLADDLLELACEVIE